MAVAGELLAARLGLADELVASLHGAAGVPAPGAPQAAANVR